MGTSPRPLLSLLLLPLLHEPLVSASDYESRASTAHFEPELFRATLRIEPTTKQVASMPTQKVAWRLPPPIAARLDDIFSTQTFSEDFASTVRSSITREALSGDTVIAASTELLDLLTKQNRRIWWTILGSHEVNRPYRWPITVKSTQLAALGSNPAYQEGVRRIRRWGMDEGQNVLFADLFSIEDAFADPKTRRAFYQELLGVDTLFLKLVSNATDPAKIQANDSYWDSGSRNHEIEPLLAAVADMPGHDRLDIAHLLPRLPRSLLYTYPPSLDLVEEPSRENAAVAAGFFPSDIDTDAVFESDFAAWLISHCDTVSGKREYGDIIVYEDPGNFRWPFAMVYIADGIVFGRRPTIYGPWEFLPETIVPELSPKLRNAEIKTFRPRRPFRDSDIYTPSEREVSRRDSSSLERLPDGPWGNLKYYPVNLAPSRYLINSLPEPSAQPTWKFSKTSSRTVRASLANLDIPETVYRDIIDLFSRARPDRSGFITVAPSLDLVLTVPPNARSVLFENLILGANATDYAQPLYTPTSLSAENWLPYGIVSDQARDIILKLTYRQGNLLTLSDYGALYHSISDPAERTTALQAFMQTPAVVVLMQRPALSELPQLLDYWGIHQQKSVASLLESFASSEEMEYLDITHLLPPLAREFTNVYVRSHYDAPTPSCYWSALNFESERPDSSLLITPKRPSANVPIVWKKLRQGYTRVEKAERLGDLVVYRVSSSDEILHICAYIAADVVFTKNGYGTSSPWCLMRTEMMDTYYLSPGIELQYYRPLRPSSR